MSPINPKKSAPKKAGKKAGPAAAKKKNRWSPEQRAAKGLAPQRRTADSRFDRDPADRFERRERTGDTYERPQRGPRRDQMHDDRAPRKAKAWGREEWSAAQENERPQRPWQRDDRRPTGGPRKPWQRDDRRDDRRDERPRFERDDRKPWQRDERRDERPRFERDDRKPWQRDERRDERPRFERDDRKPWQRDDRRTERPRFERDDRRTERPRFERDDRRTERPRFERDDRKPWQRDDRRPHSAAKSPRPFVPEKRHHVREDEELPFEADIMGWTEAEAIELDAAELTAASTEGFAELGLPAELVAALAKKDIHNPFPIQVATIPDALTGRDVLGRGRTGSGKTLAFGLPMITRIAANRGFKTAPAGMVLVPTRELALQVADVLSPLARTMGLNLALVAGGMSYGPQIRALSNGVDIVVATPGRLIDLMEQGVADLSKCLVTVLDEADHMADMGFMTEVTALLDATPADAQRLLFSATLDEAVDKLVKKYLHDPVTHEVDSSKAEVTTMEHKLLMVAPHHKNATTAWIANRPGKTVVFARTQMGTSRVAEQLRAAGVMAGALHGGLTQGARARVLAAFKDGSVPVLVATDVAARGIHVDDVSLVLQVDPPQNSKDYLHRAGRTARAGEAGVVATLVLPHQRRTMQRMAGDAGVRTEPIQLTPEDPQLVELTGAREPSGEPIEDAAYERLIAPQTRAPRPRSGRNMGRRDSRGYGRAPRR